MARKSLQDSFNEGMLAVATNPNVISRVPLAGQMYDASRLGGYVLADQALNNDITNPYAVAIGNYIDNTGDELENLLTKAKDTSTNIERTIVNAAKLSPQYQAIQAIAGEKDVDNDMFSHTALNKSYKGEGNRNWNAYTASDEDFLVKQREEPSLGSILDKYIEDYKNLPKTEYGAYPERGTTDIPDLEDKMDYNSNFQLNPYKSVKDWRDDSGIAYMAEINPYWAAGMGLANQTANPYKQRYFEGRADENLVEEARRAQEELRYNRDLEKEKTRRDLEKANYDMKKAALDTAYLDDVNKLKYNNSVSANKRKEEQDLLNITKDADVLKRDDAVKFNSLAGYKNSKIVDKPFTEETMWSWAPEDIEKLNKLLKARNREISSAANQDQVDAIVKKYDGENGLFKQLSNDARKGLLPYDAAHYFVQNGVEVVGRNVLDDMRGSSSSTAVQVLDKILGTKFGKHIVLNEKTSDSLDKILNEIGYSGSLVALPDNAKIVNEFYKRVPAGWNNRLKNYGIKPNNIVATVDEDGNIINTYVIKNGTLLDSDGTDMDNLSYRSKKASIDATKKAQEQS